MIFDHGGRSSAIHQKEHEQIYPEAGLGRARPAEIWARSQEVIDGALEQGEHQGIGPRSGRASPNQRETASSGTDTGKAVYNAIVWQDTRTDQIINDFAEDGGQDRPSAKVGLPARDLFLGPEGQVEARTTSTAPGQRPRPATSFRQHRHVVHLEPHRRARTAASTSTGRDERLPGRC
jgi:hypothetical protein